jgi:RHS repeat-associated protein
MEVRYAGASRASAIHGGCNRADDLQLRLGAEEVYDAPPDPAVAWHGTLTHDKADRSGTFYRRNRQYDPQTMRFTQEDPIGLAGGLNAYGFANGDPVSYSDPYGLSAEECCDRLGFEGDPKNVERAVQYSQNATNTERVVAGTLFRGALVGVGGAALGARAALGYKAIRRLFGRAEAPSAPPGSYRPNSPLPRTQHGRNVPSSQHPHTQLGTKTSTKTGENYTQAREWGENGTHVRDVHFTNHGRPDHSVPHQHRIDPNTGKRGSQEPFP